MIFLWVDFQLPPQPKDIDAGITDDFKLARCLAAWKKCLYAQNKGMNKYIK